MLKVTLEGNKGQKAQVFILRFNRLPSSEKLDGEHLKPSFHLCC